MPAVVVGATVLILLYVLTQLVALTHRVRSTGDMRMLIFLAVVAVLLLAGLVRGHPLAWQWGRIIPFVPILMSAPALLALLSSAWSSTVHLELVPIAVQVAVLLAMLAIPILLGRRSARRFFGLQCPSCGGYRMRPQGFLFGHATCLDCQHRWSPRRKGARHRKPGEERSDQRTG